MFEFIFLLSSYNTLCEETLQHEYLIVKALWILVEWQLLQGYSLESGGRDSRYNELHNNESNLLEPELNYELVFVCKASESRERQECGRNYQRIL